MVQRFRYNGYRYINSRLEISIKFHGLLLNTVQEFKEKTQNRVKVLKNQRKNFLSPLPHDGSCCNLPCVLKKNSFTRD
jgi:hypothetical protein